VCVYDQNTSSNYIKAKGDSTYSRTFENCANWKSIVNCRVRGHLLVRNLVEIRIRSWWTKPGFRKSRSSSERKLRMQIKFIIEVRRTGIMKLILLVVSEFISEVMSYMSKNVWCIKGCRLDDTLEFRFMTLAQGCKRASSNRGTDRTSWLEELWDQNWFLSKNKCLVSVYFELIWIFWTQRSADLKRSKEDNDRFQPKCSGPLYIAHKSCDLTPVVAKLVEDRIKEKLSLLSRIMKRGKGKSTFCYVPLVRLLVLRQKVNEGARIGWIILLGDSLYRVQSVIFVLSNAAWLLLRLLTCVFLYLLIIELRSCQIILHSRDKIV
jgi:hypothetical protein